MSALTLAGTKTALRPGNTASFGASGGTSPYTFSVLAATPLQGAGGTINASTGLYTAPASNVLAPRNSFDTIIVTDSAIPTNTAQTMILVGPSWQMVAEIFKTAMNLNWDRFWFWDQKFNMPTDNNLFLVFSLSRQKPIASNTQPSGTPIGEGGAGWSNATVWTQINATLDIHVYSRGLDAINRLPEIFQIMQGPYSRSQQRANGFYLSKIPHQANDLSSIDGSAIPYHYVISCEIIYTNSFELAPPYWNTVPLPVVEYVQA